MGVLLRKDLYTINLDSDGHDVIEKYRDAVTRTRLYARGSYNPEDKCFYCHQHLSGEAVLYWSGSNAEIALHPGCFLEMTTRLFPDLHKIELVFDYHVLKNASPRPPRPAATKPSDGEWKLWRKLRDAMRDLTVVNQ